LKWWSGAERAGNRIVPLWNGFRTVNS